MNSQSIIPPFMVACIAPNWPTTATTISLRKLILSIQSQLYSYLTSNLLIPLLESALMKGSLRAVLLELELIR